MNDYFSRFTSSGGFGSTSLQRVFDAERETPELLNLVADEMPQIHDIMISLRQALPLVPHCGIGPHGSGEFCRIPNHFRSISFMVPSQDDAGSSTGAIVFKGTEPLIADFPDYFDWMLDTPSLESVLPLGLHFPLGMQLPPAAMWIGECNVEQAISSEVHQRHLRRYGHLARLPLPLFVYKFTSQQTRQYEQFIRARISLDAFKKIEAKLDDGLGIEVYYYPSLPVRAADVHVGAGKEALSPVLTADGLGIIFDEWIGLLTRMLHLGYMPCVPWHHGISSCVDPGNACVDGGFNNLVTLVPFNSIPGESLFRHSLQLSMHALGESVLAMCAARANSPPVVDRGQPSVLAGAFVFERLRELVRTGDRDRYDADARLVRFFDTPTVDDLIHETRVFHANRIQRGTQFIHEHYVRSQSVTA